MHEQQPGFAIVSVAPCTEVTISLEAALHYVVKYGVRQVARNSRRYRGTARWVLVRDLCGFGSTSAHALCRHFGENPDEVLR